MDNGFSANDAILTSAMSGGFSGGNRGGSWGGGYDGGFANPSTLQHSIRNTSQRVEDQADSTREFLGSEVRSVDKSLENLERGNSFNRICDAINNQNNTNGQNMLLLTRELSDIRADTAKGHCDLAKEISVAAAAAAKCCCDAQLKALEQHCEILRQMGENQGALLLKMAEDKNDLARQMAEGFAGIKDRELNLANAKITQLETISALRS